MKMNHFSCDTDFRFTGDKYMYNEDKPFTGTLVIVFTGNNAKNYFSWGYPLFHKERKLNRSKHGVQLVNIYNKNF